MSAPPSVLDWASRYVGLPFADHGRTAEGCDCWGLVRLVYEAELGIALPSFEGVYASAEELAAIGAAVRGERDGAGFGLVAAAAPFDLALFRVRRFEAHVGVVVDPRREVMLHMVFGERAVIETWTAPAWRSRLVGFHRHEAVR
ncbi:C40 family peptidase [Oharaeibacter diazotrophicus]|uniref:NlpC/P60 family protein n=1 Tax=Oharaeibacter diazotrophicus TaxID=1920512 RepID=A0A4V3CW79_9HYPH|nr:NlpC/P60 family protein [Oharaeibacter diazotrophicus]TDP85398.1 NlpC/P60 family protein [Oharaeibacter diazotrophicus]BBE74368.1 gamma-DL-glutamyl hydrolase precursor [Pleomorphomonas sp. SM30]GLS75939.1 tail assembly protein [Oharaeibacter diazotrophicus]